MRGVPAQGRALSGWRRRLAVVALAVLALPFLGAGPASADGPCVPDAATGCVEGSIRSSAGQPLPGVALAVGGDAGSVSTTTAADGTWSAPVTADGKYTVTLDVTTLPPGQTLSDTSTNPRTTQVRLASSTNVRFALVSGMAQAAPSSTASASPVTSDGGGDVASEAGSGSGFNGARVAQQAASGLVFGLLLALASIGLSLIYGTTGLSNFAHGEQVTLGAILAYVFCQLVGLPLLVAAVVAVALSATSGWVQDAWLWHPLRRRRVGTTQQMIVTIGLSMALQYGFQFFFGGDKLRIVTTTPDVVTMGPVTLTRMTIVSVVIAIITLAAVSYFLLATRVGRATRAVSDSPALAAASGISVERIVRIVWTLGAGLAGLGGVLMGLYLNATSWNMGGAMLLLMFSAVTLGGLGAAFGALAGSLVIGLVVEMSSLVIPNDMRYAGALLILILVLLFRPQGILGRAERIG
ncbi:MAG TPA: branched-chain amino acid ABC transporter permease [Cellulomonas sp.]|uniref:branched-chain amino acid ABC transporter permease n=1 Tax=Cellulomonas sp. TaxID=40001 RepID=UPI002E30B161|nr:branched-chain amino acid ABC transporter permease [Cellulomonas sp.]HEX5332448.1 branched-chain amino acid ABC transporter permease [Cellulomonas sp.]